MVNGISITIECFEIVCVCVCVCVCAVLSHVWLFATPWTVAGQPHLSMKFSRQEYFQEKGVGCHSLVQGTFPTQGSNLVSYIAGKFFTIWATREALAIFLLEWELWICQFDSL